MSVYMEIKALDIIQQQNKSFASTPLSGSSVDVSMWGIEIIDEDAGASGLSDKEKAAKMEGYAKTPNSNLYYSEEDKVYYRWNTEKNKFTKAKDIKSVFNTGYCITKNGSYLDPSGNLFVKRYNTYLQPMHNYGYNLPNEMAKVYGLEKTPKEHVFFDKEENCYKVWDEEKFQFTKSPITAVTKESFYQIGDKFYDYYDKPIDEETFRVSQNGYWKTSEPGVYCNSTDNDIYYKWNKDKKCFDEFGPQIDMQELLQQKSDGVISDIRQGYKGDCWLLSSVYGLTKHNNELYKDLIKVDENGNTTINLKGVNRSYTITKEELDAAIRTKEYAAGDRDIVAFEIAFERFRKENVEQNKITGNNFMSLYYLNGYSENDYLYGGLPRNAIEVLTGKKVTSLINTGEGKYYLQDNIVKLGKLDEKMLNKYLNNQNNLVFVSLDDADPQGEAHAFVFKSQDENHVYLINPYDTSQTEKITKEEFYSKLLRIDYTDLSSPFNAKLANSRYLNIVDSEEVRQYKLKNKAE